MSYASLDDLRSHLGGQASLTPAYREKMLHPLPAMPTVDREAFIVKRCTGKRVLEFGASGPLNTAIERVAKAYVGVDREDRIDTIQHETLGQVMTDIQGFDLDDVAHAWLPVPAYVAGAPWDLIVCGETLEHLSNPGWFLTRLKRQYGGVPVIVTVPNAFAATGSAHLRRGVENVNRDHVAWYSPTTLRTLLQRHGFTILDWACYNGTAPVAEGLIVVAV